MHIQTAVFVLFFVYFRLSERNCIEIVSKLIAEKHLEVVHTLDGKEYITPSQISREIRDELQVRGGKYTDLLRAIHIQRPLNMQYSPNVLFFLFRESEHS